MTQPHFSRRLPYARGFSLIELMVSLTIGLVIVVAAMSAYLGAAGAGKMAEAQSRMNEDAQAALAILSQQLRVAGNNPIESRLYGTPTFTATPTYTLFAIRGCDGKFSDITSATSLDTLTCAGTSTLPDSIAVNYEADLYNTARTASNLPTDCLGNGLTSTTATFSPSGNTATYAVADTRLYIGTSSTIISPSLYCKGNGGSTQPLVENIEDLQLTYGTTSASTTATTVAGYLTADQLMTETSLAALSESARWKNVRTVRICIIVRSESSVVSDAASAKYFNCANPPVLTDAPDLRLRRAYTTTVVLRNRQL